MPFTVYLLPLLILLGNVFAPAKSSDGYQYELTVNSSTGEVEQFDLLIVGQTQTFQGELSPYRSELKNLSTPYELKLYSGSYSISVENKSSQSALVTKVEGLRNGTKAGNATAEGVKVILGAGPGGSYNVLYHK
jgi:hypothetical protein